MDESEFTSPEFWRALSPGFHIGDQEFFQSRKRVSVNAQVFEGFAELLKLEGYFQGSAEWELNIDAMAGAIRNLSKANLPPVLAFLYDEFWLPFAALDAILAGMLGARYMMLPSFWIWNVDPDRGDSGWQPHRDKDRKALFDDGSPKSLTVWIPLSNATPLNGCLYIVPAMLDPTYGTDEDHQWKFDYSSIRALPAGPGDFLIWNQAVLHWGGKSSPRALESRVSMSIEFQRADVPPFNSPLIESGTLLPFELRLRMIAKQILQYRHMYRIDPHVERAAWKLQFWDREQ